jgi:hypothetical protein
VLKHRLMRTLLLGVPAIAALSTTVSVVQATEECRLKPGSTAPSGSRWLYRIKPADHRHCWFLSSKAAIAHSHPTHRYRHLAGDPEAARQDQQSENDPASAPSDNTAVDAASKLPVTSQAASPSIERSSDDLVPRSVPTVVYKLPPAGVQTVKEPTVPAQSLRTVTPAATSKSNVALLAGAAIAGLCFAGGVFHFTRRVHRSARLHTVAYGPGGREEPVGVRPLVDEIPLPITSGLVEGVEQSLRDLKRYRRRARENLSLSSETYDDGAVSLPHAAAWLSRPKAKPRAPSNYQLAEA